jgi:hypothetical protein
MCFTTTTILFEVEMSFIDESDQILELENKSKINIRKQVLSK